MIFCEIIKLLTSSEINNFGVFLSGIGTFILGICAVKSLDSFKGWQEQKQFDKRSDIAEKALNRFDLFKNHFDEWMKLADSWLIFNCESQSNRKQFESLNEDDQRIFIEKCNTDPYELNNYLKRGNSILHELQLVSSKVARLQERVIVERLEELIKEIKTMLGCIAAKHFPCANSEMRDKAIKGIKESSKQINDLYVSIHTSLVKFLMFKE